MKLTVRVTPSSGGAQEYVDISGFAVMRIASMDANTINAYAITPAIADPNDYRLRRGQVRVQADGVSEQTRAEPHRQAVREAGSRVLLVDDGRQPRQPGRDHTRERHVAAEADDDTRAIAPDQRVRIPRRPQRAAQRVVVWRRIGGGIDYVDTHGRRQ